MIIRVKKEDAAYIYQVLESYEGLANHSTITENKLLPYRDIAIHTVPGLKAALERVLDFLAKELNFEVLKK